MAMYPLAHCIDVNIKQPGHVSLGEIVFCNVLFELVHDARAPE